MTPSAGFDRRGRPLGLLLTLAAAFVTLLAPSAVRGDADLGSSGIVIVKNCDGCPGDGTCTDGLCPDGSICLPYVCADGSDCGSGGLGRCDDGSACQRTRYGTRCTADGFGDDCHELEGERACRIDGLYFGSEKKCLYSLDAREPYCRVQTATNPVAYEYVPSSWEECGAGDGPSTVDVCGCDDGTACGAGGTNKCGNNKPCGNFNSPCLNGSACVAGTCAVGGAACDNTCYYALGVPKACDEGEGPCGAGGPGLCADLTRCLYDVCRDSGSHSICGTDGLCDDNSPCDVLTSNCSDTSICGSGGPGKCNNGSPCFRPKGDRARWRYATGGVNITTAAMASCTPDSTTYIDYLDPNIGQDPQIGSRALTGLNPKPVANECLYFGSMDSHFFAMDEESLPPQPSPTPVAGKFRPPARGACLWHWDTEGPVQVQAAGHPDDDRIFIGSDGNKLWDLRTYPVHPAPSPTPGRSDNPYDFALTLQPFNFNLGTDIRGEVAVMPQNDEGATPDRIVVGSQRGLELFDVSARPSPYPVAVPSPGGAAAKPYTRGVDIATDGAIYSGVADDSGPSAVRAFELVDYEGGGEKLQMRGEVDKDTAAITSNPEGCLAGGGNTDFTGVQFHRSTPVLNATEDFFFIGNRHGSGNDLSARLLAFRAIDANDNTPDVLEGPSLFACYDGTGQGITAPIAYARVPCEDAGCCAMGKCCAADAGEIDRLFFGDRDKNFYGVNFCPENADPGESDPVFYDAFTPKEKLHEFRSQGAVSLELGTVYAFDENTLEHVYAFDIYNGDLKWEYHVADAGYDVDTSCSGRPAGGENCYPAPIPIVVDVDLNFDEENDDFYIHPVDEDGCWYKEDLYFLVGAHQYPRSRATNELDPFVSPDMDVGASNFSLVRGIDGLHISDTQKQPFHWNCVFDICGGGVTLEEGWNEFIVTTYDKAGKSGSTKVRVEYCPGGCPCE